MTTFDPEKVERFSYYELGISEYVSASDYDQLLERYRNAKEQLRQEAISPSGSYWNR